MKKWLISFLTMFMLVSVGSSTLTAKADTANINASAALAVDADTGQILYQKNASQVLPIASISKLLAVSVIIDEINTGKISWDTKVTINEKIATLSQSTALSNVELTQGKQYTVKQLVDAALIKSADGATLALSTMNGDTVASFNEKMQKKAKSMGVKDAVIYNAVGLQNSDLGDLKLAGVADSVENEMSAKDVATISAYLIKHDPEVLKITATKSESLDGTEMNNLNTMLPGEANAVSGYTTDGLKTGTSDAAGESFVGTGTYQGHRIITVILHANGLSRYQQTANLVKYVTSEFKPVTISSSKKLKQATTVKVANGKSTQLATTYKKSTTLWLPSGTTIKDIRSKLQVAKKVQDKKGRLAAPIKKGQTIGYVAYRATGLKFMNSNAAQVSLKAKTTVKKANVIVLIWRHVTGEL